MYVRRKSFVRRKSSSGGSSWYVGDVEPATGIVALARATALLSFVIALPILAFGFIPLQLPALKVDPQVEESLALGKPVYAYVSVKSGFEVGGYIRVWRFGDVKVYKILLTSAQELRELSGNPNVLSIYAEKSLTHAPLHYLDVTQYPIAAYDADNRLHKADGMWGGGGVTVAVIDTGIDYTHPDFFDSNNVSIIRVLVSVLYKWVANGTYVEWNLERNPDVNALLDFDTAVWKEYGEPAFLDINGHGTHVAGIIAGRGRASGGKYVGIAPKSKLVVIKAFDKDGSASMDSCLEGLEWVYNNSVKYGIKVLSLSWGAAFASDGSDPLSLAVDKIYVDRGVWVFVAAGNEGNIPTTVVVPAVARHAFAVGAWDPYYNKIAPFSSLGPTTDLRMKPDFMGAGVMVVSCRSQYVDFPNAYKVGNYYVALSGTSMATPAVAGTAADFIEYFRYWHGRDPTAEDFIMWVELNGARVNFVKDFITGWGIPVAPHG